MDKRLKIFFCLLLSIMIVISSLEVQAITMQPYYTPLYNLYSNYNLYKNNPQTEQLIYIDSAGKIAISQKGKIYLLETDYSGNIIGIRDQHVHVHVIYLKNDMTVNRLGAVFNNMNTNHIFNPYYYLPSN